MREREILEREIERETVRKRKEVKERIHSLSIFMK